MCEYCENDKTILQDEFVDRSSWGWGGDIQITESQAIEKNIGVFVDRGCLRMADLDDCNCIESGKKVEIYFCPFCGEQLNSDQ